MKIKTGLKPGEVFTGKVDSVSNKTVVFELENESKVKLPLPEDVCDSLNDDYDEEIVTITRSKDGDEYDIVEHEEWPKEKK